MRYTGNITNVKTMSLDPVLKALYKLVRIETDKLQIGYDKKCAADTASIRVLTTDVSKLKDYISAYEKLSKENSASSQKMVDKLLDHVHKLMLNIDSIKDEMTDKIEELEAEICTVKDYVVTVEEETSTKVNKMEGNIEEIADEMTNTK